MVLQKVRKWHRIKFMVEAKHSNIAALKEIPAYAGMTTYAFCESIKINGKENGNNIICLFCNRQNLYFRDQANWSGQRAGLY